MANKTILQLIKHPFLEILEFSRFRAKCGSHPLLDIRSPAEYANGHIPGAISFPLFSNEERAQVGTLYKSKGKREAVKTGLEIVGPKMVEFVNRAEALGTDLLTMYCWRGGMRSASMGWLLENAGFKISVLEGGYKTYRRTLHQYFEQPLNLRVISGYTGSRKTDFLKMLGEHGAQVIDLEKLAQHQGSSFGNQKSVSQPSTEQFQNLTFDAFLALDKDRIIWIEDECLRIGQVTMIEALHRQKESSPHIFIEIPKSQRVAYLVGDYGSIGKPKLIEATKGIQRKLGGVRTKRAIEFILKGQLKEAVNIILEYYDKQYQGASSRKQDQIVGHYQINMAELQDLAKELIEEENHVI